MTDSNTHWWRKAKRYRMTMTMGSGKEEMTALSCAALSASFFISEGNETIRRGKKADDEADTLLTLLRAPSDLQAGQTYECAPAAGPCSPWGPKGSPATWSRASALLPQSQGRISVPPGDPLLQGKPTVHCPKLLRACTWRAQLNNLVSSEQ